VLVSSGTVAVEVAVMVLVELQVAVLVSSGTVAVAVAVLVSVGVGSTRVPPVEAGKVRVRVSSTQVQSSCRALRTKGLATVQAAQVRAVIREAFILGIYQTLIVDEGK
jgi:hypothetical protein